jgi:putative aldouronate transport system substrate-binding protein
MKQSRILASIVAALIILSACSGNAQQPQTSSASSVTQPSDTLQNTADNNAEATAEDGPLAPYPETVSVTALKYDSSAIRFGEGDTIENNVWMNAYREELNIDLKVTMLAVGMEDFQQKVTVMIASNTMPDFVQLPGKEFRQLLEAGRLEDLTEAYEKYASDGFKDVIAGDGGTQLATAKKDGRLYGFPKTSGVSRPTAFLWIRLDWLENLGLELPKTFDDVIAIAEAFKTTDPDGNGLDDTYGLGLCNEMVKTSDAAVGNLEGIVSAFGGHLNGYLYDEATKTVNYTGISAEVRKGLEAANDLYKRGLIDPEFSVKKSDNVGSDMSSSKIGLLYGAHWLSWGHAKDSVTNDPRARWFIMNAPLAEGGDAPQVAGYNNETYFAVRKGFEHPEALFKVANLCEKYIQAFGVPQDVLNKYGVDPVTGINYLSYTYAVADPVTDKFIRNARMIKDVYEGRANEDTLYPEALRYWKAIEQYLNDGHDDYSVDPNDIVAYQYFGEFGPLEGCGQTRWAQLLDNKKVLWNVWMGIPTAAMTEKGSTLDKLQAETFTNIITGDAPITAFDDFVTSWKSIGGDQICAEVAEQYNEVLAN